VVIESTDSHPTEKGSADGRFALREDLEASKAAKLFSLK
jgi:hypothetical protein